VAFVVFISLQRSDYCSTSAVKWETQLNMGLNKTWG